MEDSDIILATLEVSISRYSPERGYNPGLKFRGHPIGRSLEGKQSWSRSIVEQTQGKEAYPFSSRMFCAIALGKLFPTLSFLV